jgi:inosine-uridine nucleoside N-ribohydrolase
VHKMCNVSKDLEMSILNQPSTIDERKDLHFVARILANYRKKEVSLVAITPLTKIAKAIIEDPEIVDSLSRIYIMGGTYELASKVYGNIIT